MGENEESDKLQILAEDYHEFSLESSPSYATIKGDHRFNSDIENFSEEALDQKGKKIDKFVELLNSLDSGQLSHKDLITYGMLEFTLKNTRQSLQDRTFEYDAGVAGWQKLLLDYHPMFYLPNEESATKLHKRIEKYKDLFEQVSSLQRKALKEGRTATARNVSRTIEQVENYLSLSVEEDLLLKVNFVPEIANDFINSWKETSIEKIEKYVRPAVQSYLELLKGEVLQQSRDDDKCGIIWNPNGEEFYERQLIRYTDDPNATAQKVHQVGMDEIERLKDEFANYGEMVFEPGIEFKSVISRMQTDPSMRYESEEQMLELAEEAIKRAYEPLSEWFTVFPEAPCKVVPVPPESAEHAPPAYYWPPSQDGSRPGTYFLNTYDSTSKSIFEAESVAFHEAIPGHHMDRTIASELKGVPEFQKYAASTAFVEGWGLYSEQLANEMGLYSNDVQQLGRLGNDAWRACRLVLDTGMHGMGWSRDQAISFFLENSPIEKTNANIETDRYIAWPGQACAYKMGQLAIIDLRKKAEKELGDRFDIRQFHDEVLKDGGITIPILRSKIEQFIVSN
ncbi:MAG: DUF885 domain-containing protein [Candidatus Actinomarinales bacterium]|nr:MAG: DUF885 domain-containing protein [Candidatus Actinomarinales bacterium]